METALTGALIIVAAWLTCAFVITVLFLTVWSRHAATQDDAHGDSEEWTVGGYRLPVHLHENT